MNADNVALARRWFEEVWNQRREETIDELVSEESVCHSDAGVFKGPQEFKHQFYAPFLSLIPDLKVTVEGTIAQGDEVVVRWHATGTHTGTAFDLPATGRTVSFRGMTWVRGKDGKLVEGRDCWNVSGLFQSLRAQA